MNKAVVLLSGGQDSTTCFYSALDRYDEIAAVAFDYGQRHRVELDLAQRTADLREVPLTILPVDSLSALAGASLTNPAIANVGHGEERNSYADERGLPPSFVPGRNALFFTLAAAWGVPRGFDTIVTGVCQQDHSGYPDCRAVFVGQMEQALRLALDWPDFKIDAPLLWLDKAETWALADKLGVLPEIILGTHTCYEGVRDSPPWHWGYGCGECAACDERRKGYERFRAASAVGA